MSRSMYTRPLDVPDLVEYLESVKTEYSQDAVVFSRFLFLMRDWCHGNSMNIDTFIEKVAVLLRNKPRLLQDFNALLPPGYRIECDIDVDSVTLLTVITPTGARIQTTANSSLAPPSPHITNTDELRCFLSLDNGWQQIVDLEADWAACVLQLLQTDLDNQWNEPQYRKKCLRCLRALVQKSKALPPSFFLRNVVREGDHPILCGGFADIYKGHLNRQALCLKVLRFQTKNIPQEKLFKEFCHEAIVWRQLSHPNVLPFFGASVEVFPSRFCLISPWMDHGNINDFLKVHPDHDRLTSIFEIANGLLYLHKLTPRIVHGDIKGPNILVTDDLHCCLGDFGLATIVESQRACTSEDGKGTIRWLAPELMDPNGFPGSGAEVKTASDVYAFGCTVLEIYTGKEPFSEYKWDAAVIHNVVRGVRPNRPPPEVLADEIWAVVESCWTQQPQDRPTIGKVTQVLAGLLNARTDNNPTLALNSNSPVVDSTAPTSDSIPLETDPAQNIHVRSWLKHELLYNTNVIPSPSPTLSCRLSVNFATPPVHLDNTTPTLSSGSSVSFATPLADPDNTSITALPPLNLSSGSPVNLVTPPADPDNTSITAPPSLTSSRSSDNFATPTAPSDNTGPPSPTLSSWSSANFATPPASLYNTGDSVPPTPSLSPLPTLALRSNIPDIRIGLTSLNLLGSQSVFPHHNNDSDTSASSLATFGGTEPDCPGAINVPLPLAYGQSPRAASAGTVTTVNSRPRSPAEKKDVKYPGLVDDQSANRRRRKRDTEVKAPGRTNPKLQSALLHDTDIDPSPFHFKPYQLSQMFDPKNLELLQDLGGVDGLLKGLGTSATTGIRGPPQAPKKKFWNRIFS